MKYSMRSNVLFDEKNRRLAYIHASASYLKSKIRSADGEIIIAEFRMNSSYDARDHEYVVTDKSSNVIATAKPQYSDSDDPMLHGWPLNRAPLVDSLNITVNGDDFKLTRIGYPKYEIKDTSGKLVLGLGYSPLMKTWSLNGTNCFSPLLICGIICFCKYLEFENEAVFL